MKKHWIKKTYTDTLPTLYLNCIIFLFCQTLAFAAQEDDLFENPQLDIAGLKVINQSQEKEIDELKRVNNQILARLRKLEKEKEKTEAYLYLLKGKSKASITEINSALSSEVSNLYKSQRKALFLIRKIRNDIKTQVKAKKDGKSLTNLQKDLSDLDRIIKSSLTAGRFGNSPSSDGRVISVNALNVAVAISLGYRDGIKTGSRLKVLKGEKELATITVIETGIHVSLAIVSKGEVTDIPIGASVKK